MGADKRRWLELLIPSFRLRQQIEVLENTNRELQEEIDRQAKAKEELRGQVKRRDQMREELQERVKKQQAVIEKLNKKLDTTQFERDEVYDQYNRLLANFSGSEEPTRVSDSFEIEKPGKEDEKKLVESTQWRLNIGCGRVKKSGYLNVDVDGSVKPDLVFSLDLPLPFASSIFDLIEAYHVVEHVYPWTILNILKELWRVLRPGGGLAIECPSIESACAWLLRNSQYGLDSQMGMWAIYGDPNPKNPFHMHRWGYTPITLAGFLKQAGFVRIQRDVPETHVPARDFRMTATKPVP
jgi:predicted SAM-dependent methyltransferase/uncharacterized coiled-coil protein SlyX